MTTKNPISINIKHAFYSSLHHCQTRNTLFFNVPANNTTWLEYIKLPTQKFLQLEIFLVEKYITIDQLNYKSLCSIIWNRGHIHTLLPYGVLYSSYIISTLWYSDNLLKYKTHNIIRRPIYLHYPQLFSFLSFFNTLPFFLFLNRWRTDSRALRQQQ